MYCKFYHLEMIFGPFEKMTFFGEHPLNPERGEAPIGFIPVLAGGG